MRRKLTFRQKLFLNFSLTFAVFTILVLVFQFERERNFRRNNFEITLDNIAELSYRYYQKKDYYEQKGFAMIDSLTAVASDLDIRVTIIDREGTVVFDSEVGDVSSMENHLDRPEVQEALRHGKGSNIRGSETTGRSYYYYARAFPDYFVRAAAIYDIRVRESLHVETLFITYLVLMFMVFSIILMFITRRISETITKLKDFAIRLRSGKEPPEDLQFPDDDLGEISSQIISIYRELNKAQQEILDEQEKGKLFKQQMTSNIAHELKTPVTSILGYLETLQEEDIPKKTRKRFLKGALRQTQRLSGLIEDISSLSKIVEAAESYSMETLRVRKIVDEVHQHLKLKLDEHHISVSISIPKKIEIRGNASLLFSVFYNLFDNVIKYGGENIEIKLENYFKDRKYYYFSFYNSGNPVEEIHLNRIFERFYRIDTGRSREQGGTGLGLSIVKNAIELHGGTITAKSHPQGGLEFLFTLSK